MGLLTSPSSGDTNPLLNFIQKHSSKLGILSFLSSLVWMGLLANPNYNLGTYFSENALLPGLVLEHFDSGYKVNEYIHTLQNLEKSNPGGRLSPTDLTKLFHKIGLVESGTQNFSLVSPVTVLSVANRTNGASRIGLGYNSYGILRAKRADGTESLILNAPYFPKNGANKRNIPGIAMMLVLAEYFQEQVYWAKDIVFLVADGHVGSLAWIKGHQEIHEPNSVLNFERVAHKVGNIQAGINFILEGKIICSFESKFHGVNGQLPNLDLVNLLNKFIVPESEKRSNWEADAWKLFNYMTIQASSSPTGSHGYFLKYGVESVTLFGKSIKNCRRPITFDHMGRLLEAIYRSLNNLLEKLHQSFFFYLKTTPNRFISIGLYYPPIALTLLALPLKASSIWLSKSVELEPTSSFFYLATIHSISIACRWILSNFEWILETYAKFEVRPSPSLFYYTFLSLVGVQFIITYALLRSQRKRIGLVHGIYCLCLLELGTVFYVLGLLNPSISFLVGLILVPLATFGFWGMPGKLGHMGSLLLIGVGVAVGSIILMQYDSQLTYWTNKSYYEKELYGNVLFNLGTLVLVPVLGTLMSIL